MKIGAFRTDHPTTPEGIALSIASLARGPADTRGGEMPRWIRDAPARPLETRGLTLLEIDHEAEGLFVGSLRGDGGAPDWRSAFLGAKAVCQRVYTERYPEYALAVEEPYDANAVLLYSRSSAHVATGVLRVCFDSDRGLPSECSLSPETDTLRRCGVRIAEPGRFAIADGDRPREALYKAYLRALYQVARAAGVEVYLMQVRGRHADFYRRNCAAVDLNSELAAPGCVNLAWNIERTPRRFFRVFGPDQGHLDRFLATEE